MRKKQLITGIAVLIKKEKDSGIYYYIMFMWWYHVSKQLDNFNIDVMDN